MDWKSINGSSLFLIFLGIFIHLFGLGGFDIYILDEAKNAEAAREMLVSGDWIVPRFNGEPRYDKPPLHYYFFSLGYQLFGVNAFGARFFSGVMGIVTFLAVFLKIWQRKDQKSAQLGVLALLASPHFLIQFHLAVPDPFLICFLTLTLFFVESYIFSDFSSKKDLRLSCFFLGLAVLSKGPLGVVLLGATLLIYSLFPKGRFWENFRQFFDFPAILIFLLVVLPWYVLVALETNGTWLEEFVFHHNLNRFSSTMEGHGGPFYLPPLMVFVGFLPTSGLVLLSLFTLKKELKVQPLLRLSLIFSAVILVFFMFSKTKLPNYTAPIYPFLAVVIGLSAGQLFKSKYLKILLFGSMLVPLALGISLKVFGPQIRELSSFPNLWWLVIPSSVIAMLGFVFLVNSRRVTGYWLICLSYVSLSMGLLGFGFPWLDSQNPVKSALKTFPKSTQFSYWKRYNPAFPFNSEQVILPWDQDKFTENTLVLTTAKALKEEPFPIPFDEVFRAQDLFEGTETVILKPRFAEK